MQKAGKNIGKNGRAFDAILFDLGSTLIYFEGEWPQIVPELDNELVRQLHAAGINVNREEFAARFRERLESYYFDRDTEFIEYTTAYILQKTVAEFGYPDLPDEVIRQALAAMYTVSQARWKTEKDAIPTLKKLRSQGYKLGMISNAGDDADVQRLVDNAQLRPYFDMIITSAAEGIRKPNPLIFHTALDHWGYKPEQAAMVGDTLGADILGAHHAGMVGIWITRRADTTQNRAHVETISPDYTIATLSELPPLLDQIALHR